METRRLLTEYSINYDATTLLDAYEYMDYRTIQLLKFGFTKVSSELAVIDGNEVAVIYNFVSRTNKNEKYYSAYLLHQYRGMGLFKQVVADNAEKTIVTLIECGISDYLIHLGVKFELLSHSSAYEYIQNYYGDDRANRSGVPYIYHIDEGLAYMLEVDASDVANDAYCLHPIFQSDEAFNENWDLPSLYKLGSSALLMAMEYRRVANSYLSRGKQEDFVGFTNEHIFAMLYGDKVQNHKDFRKYHFETHERSDELDEYFRNWLVMLYTSEYYTKSVINRKN